MEEKIITVRDLQDKLNRHEKVFILDVRPSEQRAEWKITESTHIDIYDRLRQNDENALDGVEIPANATVVTVCAAGKTSLTASRLLRNKGIDAYSLQGGMKAWNFAWSSAQWRTGDVTIIQVRRNAKGILSYIVGSGTEAVVIDAALDPDVYRQLADQNGWSIRYAMDTHVHADFISRTRDLARATGAVHAMPETSKVDFQFDGIADGESIHFGSTSLQVIHTPGHTWESVTYKLKDSALFTGDTLFVDGVGRPDLKADRAEGVEKARALYRSLRRIASFDDAILVLPAHTSDTVPFDDKLISETLGNIRSRINAIQLSESDFITYATSKVPPLPPNYMMIATINKTGSYEGQDPAELEAGGNHCAIR